MTGKDMIIYILQNNLENSNVENVLAEMFMNVPEVAVIRNVGEATVKAWYNLGILPGVKIGNNIYIFRGGVDNEQKA